MASLSIKYRFNLRLLAFFYFLPILKTSSEFSTLRRRRTHADGDESFSNRPLQDVFHCKIAIVLTDLRMEEHLQQYVAEFLDDAFIVLLINRFK